MIARLYGTTELILARHSGLVRLASAVFNSNANRYGADGYRH